MKKTLKTKRLTTKIIIINSLLYLICSLILYFLTPYILNYPNEFVNSKLEYLTIGMSYTNLFLGLAIIAMLASSITIYFQFHKINLWNDYKNAKLKHSIKDIISIRNLCYNNFYKNFFLQLAIIILFEFIFLNVISTDVLFALKYLVIVIFVNIISYLLTYIYSYNNIFKQILKESYHYVEKEGKTLKRNSIRGKLIGNGVSILIVAFFSLSIFTYSEIITQRAKFLNEKNLNDLRTNILNYKENIIEYINTNKLNYFVIDEKFNVIYDNSNLSKFAIDYISSNLQGNITYNSYNFFTQGAFEKVNINSKVYYIGTMYNVIPLKYTYIFISYNLFLILAFLIFLDYISKNVKNELDNITNNLIKVAKKDNNIKNLPIISNDELADVIEASNQVNNTFNNLWLELKKNQETFIKQGKFASLGELVSGIIHDINTPVSTVKNGLSLLKQMSDNKTDDEMKLIDRMDKCTNTIINIINSIKNQVRNDGKNNNVTFNITDVIEDVKVITYNEIIKNKCELKIKILDELEAKGNPSQLGQVITNLVINAAQAYNKKGGVINVTVSKAPNYMTMIKITDYASGLDDEVKEYIFKDIYTTKGNVGTGLGLYISYITIKEVFNGEIIFDSQKGSGTTFYVLLPRKKQ